jgi:hypothetical protein
MSSISNCEVTEAYAAMDERRTIKFLRSYQTVAGPHHHALCRRQVRRFVRTLSEMIMDLTRELLRTVVT